MGVIGFFSGRVRLAATSSGLIVFLRLVLRLVATSSVLSVFSTMRFTKRFCAVRFAGQELAKFGLQLGYIWRGHFYGALFKSIFLAHDGPAKWRQAHLQRLVPRQCRKISSSDVALR